MPNTFAQSSHSSQFTRASKLIRQGEWKEAEEILIKVVRTEPRNAVAWFFLGFSYHSQEKMRPAISAYKNSIKISKNSDAIYNLAAAYARSGETEKALDWLEKFVNVRKISSFYLSKVDGDFKILRKHPRFQKILEKTVKIGKPCMELKNARQLDFWVGDWIVRDRAGGGRLMGENLIELGADGCVLLENWQGRMGHKGKSLSSYNPTTKKWKQFFVGNTGATVELEGVYKNNVMRMRGETIDSRGKKMLHILELHNLANKTVWQVRKISKDNGRSWDTIWDATYIRKK